MEDEKGKAHFSAINKTMNMLDTGKKIRSKVMGVKSGSRLRISQIQYHIKVIFLIIAMRKKGQFNTKMDQNTLETLSME